MAKYKVVITETNKIITAQEHRQIPEVVVHVWYIPNREHAKIFEEYLKTKVKEKDYIEFACEFSYWNSKLINTVNSDNDYYPKGIPY
jgi:hypothetical protein